MLPSSHTQKTNKNKMKTERKVPSLMLSSTVNYLLHPDLAVSPLYPPIKAPQSGHGSDLPGSQRPGSITGSLYVTPPRVAALLARLPYVSHAMLAVRVLIVHGNHTLHLCRVTYQLCHLTAGPRHCVNTYTTPILLLHRHNLGLGRFLLHHSLNPPRCVL